MTRLGKLVALANRPGTPAEGDAARAKAERLAEAEGVELVETTNGALLATDELRADMLRALRRIADGPAGELGP